MQLLTFQVGVYLLAVPAQRVLSVGREEAEAHHAGLSAVAVDLAAILDPDGERAEQRPVIRYHDSDRTVELKVDRILALENCADGAIQPWPGLLKSLPLFTAVAVIGDRAYQIIDIAVLTKRGKGRRR